MLNRPRRLRQNKRIRNLVKENVLNANDFIYPLFLIEGENIKREIPTLPDVFHFSLDRLEDEIKELNTLGLKHIILFGVPDQKDELGSEAYSPEGIVQKGIRKIKAIDPSMYVTTDICMCQYTSHGHCGLLSGEGQVLNDQTLEILSKIAVSHAEAGADMVAPSDMMDGRVRHIRLALDQSGYNHVPIMSYSAKYASNYYGPFREAAHSAPSFGDRKAYQMDYANSREAIKETMMDIEEGADIVMVKPALSYLDIIYRIKDVSNLPVAAYNVSGEYAMMKFAIQQGLVKESIIEETLTSMKRAGADIIITYFAKEVVKKWRQHESI